MIYHRNVLTCSIGIIDFCWCNFHHIGCGKPAYHILRELALSALFRTDGRTIIGKIGNCRVGVVIVIAFYCIVKGLDFSIDA